MYYENVFRSLQKNGIRYAVAGGVALVLHGVVRFTADLHQFECILAKKFSATKQERETAVALIAEAAKDIAHPSETPSGACRDSDDDNVLACAVKAEAECLVSGDKDPLHLKTFKGIRIITPRDFELLFDA